jgi:hypothetical protein
MFDVVMYHTLYKLWWLWHCSLRNVFGRECWTSDKPRPQWHLCCNGNAGGWRTRVCDWLEDYETGYRKYQRKLDDRSYWD